MSDEWDRALLWLRARLREEEQMALQQRDLAALFGEVNQRINEAQAEGVPTEYYDQLLERLRWHIGKSRRARVAAGKAPMSDADEANGRTLARIESDRRILATYDTARDAADHDAESEARFYLMADVVKAFAQRYAHLPDFPEVLRLDHEGTTP